MADYVVSAFLVVIYLSGMSEMRRIVMWRKEEDNYSRLLCILVPLTWPVVLGPALVQWCDKTMRGAIPAVPHVAHTPGE